MTTESNSAVRTIAVLDAPSNLGLRSPAPGVVPGCYKLAGALRDQRLLDRIGATDAGCVVPPRYDSAGWQPGDGVMNGAALVAYTRGLADRIGDHVASGDFLVLLGGDCSILFGAALALRRRGRYGLAYIDGSSDFRHVGNAPYVGASAGEGVALVTGRGQPDIVDIDGLRPYVDDRDLVVLGVRDYDEYLDELGTVGIPVWTVPAIRETGPERVGTATVRAFSDLDGYWVHFDVDALDPTVMPAVDAPDPGGLDYPEAVSLLRSLLADPGCVGVNITIFDPDLDPDGTLAPVLADNLVEALSMRASA